jgi:hypothetical protein
MLIHTICCLETEIFLIAEALTASHEISSFKIQKSILERCQCIIDSNLSGRYLKIIKESCEIFVVTEICAQAVSLVDRVGYRKIQEDLGRLQVLADLIDKVG